MTSATSRNIPVVNEWILFISLLRCGKCCGVRLLTRKLKRRSFRMQAESNAHRPLVSRIVKGEQSVFVLMSQVKLIFTAEDAEDRRGKTEIEIAKNRFEISNLEFQISFSSSATSAVNKSW